MEHLSTVSKSPEFLTETSSHRDACLCGQVLRTLAVTWLETQVLRFGARG